jgi:hypothetical protein
MNAGFIAYYARRYDEALALIRGVPLRFIRIPRRRFFPKRRLCREGGHDDAIREFQYGKCTPRSRTLG